MKQWIIAGMSALLLAGNVAVANARAEDNAYWLKKETQRLIEGCQIEDVSGALLHAPDGIGHYKGMWIREYYFIARYAGNSSAMKRCDIQPWSLPKRSFFLN